MNMMLDSHFTGVLRSSDSLQSIQSCFANPTWHMDRTRLRAYSCKVSAEMLRSRATCSRSC